MYSKIHSRFYSGVSRRALWRIWEDVDNWPSWHADLDACHLQGAFKVGNHFILKPKGGRAVKILLTEINEGHSFTDCTCFFGAKMFDTHIIEEKNDGVLLTNKLVVTGPLQWLWVVLVAKDVAATVPADMDALIDFAKQTELTDD